MPSLEERVAYLRQELGEFRADTHRRFDELRGEVVDLRKETSRRFETLDGKIDRHFTWLVGIQVAVLVAVVGTLVGSYYR